MARPGAGQSGTPQLPSGGGCPVTVLSPQTVSPGTPSGRLILFPVLINRPRRTSVSHFAMICCQLQPETPPFQPSSSWQGFSYSQGAPDPSLPRSGGLWQMAELLPFGASGEALRVRSWTVDE